MRFTQLWYRSSLGLVSAILAGYEVGLILDWLYSSFLTELRDDACACCEPRVSWCRCGTVGLMMALYRSYWEMHSITDLEGTMMGIRACSLIWFESLRACNVILGGGVTSTGGFPVSFSSIELMLTQTAGCSIYVALGSSILALALSLLATWRSWKLRGSNTVSS